jgi:6-phosphogluconolactonase (cycloisomerase 2 family)
LSIGYIGSFSTWGAPAGRGLDVVTADEHSGALTLAGTVPGVPDASFLTYSLNRRILYAANELTPHGTVTALDLGDPAHPEVLNTRPSGGAGPTHLSVHTSGRYLLTANHGGGSVAVHPIEPDGRLCDPTDVVRHQDIEPGSEPHAHQVLTDPSGRWVLAVDLGTDSVQVYRLDLATGRLRLRERLRLPDGTGPRHLAFHSHGRFAYLLGELRPEITVASWDPAGGVLNLGQVLPTAAPGNFPAEIAVSRDGRFVYVSNRGDNTIATFTVSDAGARLTAAGSTPTGGDWPRHFTLSPDERWVYVANQRSGTVTRLPRDPATGQLGRAQDPLPVGNVGIVLL